MPPSTYHNPDGAAFSQAQDPSCNLCMVTTAVSALDLRRTARRCAERRASHRALIFCFRPSAWFEALQLLGERLQDLGSLSRRHASVRGRKWPAAIVCLDMLPDGPLCCWQIGVDME